MKANLKKITIACMVLLLLTGMLSCAASKPMAAPAASPAPQQKPG